MKCRCILTAGSPGRARGAAVLGGIVLLVIGCGGPVQNAETGGEKADAREESAHAHDDDERGREAGGHEEEEKEHEAEGVVRLTREQIAATKVAVETAGPGRIDLGVELPGAVRPDGDRLAHIVPRFPGIVVDVRRTVGDVVRTGDVLAVIESSESLAPYELKTLLDGTIISRHVTRGEAVDRETQVFAIADLGKVWVELSVFQKDLPRVHIGSAVRIGAAHEAPEAEGVVSYVTPGVDEGTRTATARVVLPNPDGRWRPGMFVTGRVLEEADVPVAVPVGALQTVEERTVVFAAVEQGFEVRFEARPVTLGRTGESRAEIVSGLAAGERYAATNTFVLKAELGKGEAEHGH